MEPSEASSAPTSPTKQSEEDAGLGVQPLPDTSNGDPDPASSDIDHAAEEVGGIEEQFGDMGLKEKEEVVESETKEKGEESEDDLGGGQVEKGNGESEDSDGGENLDGNGDENVNEGEVENGGDLEKNDDGSGSRRYQYPVRPDAEDCSYYLKTGTCKFGSNCKFNHPVRRKPNQGVKEKVKEHEELPERPGQTECKYYLRSGDASMEKHVDITTQGKNSSTYSSRVQLSGPSNPTGMTFRFNHPDPTASGGGDTSSGYGNGGPVALQGATQSTIPPWSSPRSLNESAPYVPMLLSPIQGVPSQNSEWNGYQAPVYLPERSLPPPPAYVMNNPVTETNVYSHHQPNKQVDEFPERPGQPECTYFVKLGIDQNICTYYSRYGICKFGPACKFDHSVHPTPTIPVLGHQHPYGDSATLERAGSAGSRNRGDSTIQQSV
ncbi:hypothetical protein FNV43_RR19989 [Rhamnella rubrinervis]|uniref:C3H1-type domain-containing protein n=1 Tax=Rhamnella rubrinervis TaxID=2594499 RepID=A0A8K0DYV8_9ROSA|nr:hypothetical protein FNV43_RR19989 [Rhamnella rubrinervis]